MTRAAFTLLLLMGSAALAQGLSPPQVIESPPATYPAGSVGASSVVLDVTIDALGEVTETTTVEGAGTSFETAAKEAVRRWRFRPAIRNGQPVPARVRIPFAFEPPPPPVVATSPDAGTVAVAPDAGLAVETKPITRPPDDAPREVRVRGTQRILQRGGSDFHIELGKLAANTNGSASDVLRLAPGIFLGNEGGQGHADQVFLRGFNAEQGQQIEFTVNGVPINERDNPDGHGYADTHFIIPELVKSLRVVEGPFDPHQGDFAVAGSVAYELGVPERGIRLEGWLGTFASRRLLAVVAPPGEREGTFIGAQFFTSDGFGVNRASSQFSVMAQYEGELGQRGLWRLLATAYSTHYGSAGVVRLDDVQSGRVGFYGSEDPSQGGDAQRYTVSAEVENPLPSGNLHQQVFLTWRTLRIQEDFTGFLLDVPRLGESPHAQRGDGFVQSYSAFTAGARGSYRASTKVLGQTQSLEIGYFARYDHTTPKIDRVRFGTQIPYQVDLDETTDVFNLAAFLDLDLHFFSWLTVRGGVRQEYFGYNVLLGCDTAGNVVPNAPLDVTCPNFDRAGPREPSRRVTAAGQIFEPKVTVLAQARPWLTFTASYGVGAQSADALLISQDASAPFSKLVGAEGGAMVHRNLETWDLTGRLLGYYTHVDQDLIFNPQLGRLAASTGTTRGGFVVAGRATSRFFDELVSATYARAVFDDDHTLVPYVPIWVARSDTVLFGAIPGLVLTGQPFIGQIGFTASYLGSRALPLGQFSLNTLQLDANASIRWRILELGIRVLNLTDRRYALSQFFYASDFHSRDYPTLAPAAHFTAAAPRTIFFTVSVILGRGGSWW